MNKNYNLLLILSGFIVLILFLFFGESIFIENLFGVIISWIIILLGSFLISLGVINYTRFKLWLKIVITIVLMAIVIFIWGFFGLAIYGI